MITINTESNIAVILFWIEPEEFLRNIPEKIKKKINIIGNIFSLDGINFFIKNLFEKYNNINIAILFGRDQLGIGDALIDVAKGNCPNWLRLDCNILTELNLKIIDLRNKNYIDIINAIDSEYRVISTARNRKIVELTTPREDIYPYQVGWAVISETDIKRLHIKTLDYILTYGFLKNNKLISFLIIQNISYKSKELRNIIRTCDVIKEWPCGLTGSGFEAVILTPAYVSIEDVALARAIVRQNWRAVYSADVLDTRGNFVIAPPQLLHYTQDGALYREIELDEVSARREASKLFPEHAFYLGREFSAYRILRDKYSQEKWRLALDQSQK